MKKSLLTSIISTLLIIVMIVSFVQISYFVRPCYRGNENDVIWEFYKQPKNSFDAVYVGGSACYVYWEPLRAWNRHGFTSYNFASDTIPPQSIENYIKEVSKTQTPKLWIIDLRPFQYGNELYDLDPTALNMYHKVPIKNGVDHMKYSLNRLDLINKSVPKLRDKISYCFDFEMYHPLLKKDIIKEISGSGQRIKNSSYSDDNIQGKFLPESYKGFKFIVMTKTVTLRDNSSVTEECRLPDELDSIFSDLLDYCSGIQGKVLFVVHSYCETEQHKKLYNYMEKAIVKSGLDYIDLNDFNDKISFDPNMDFYNDNHVNVFGAEKYTDFLSDYIAKKYNLPDKRNSDGYSEWDNDFAEFEKESSRIKGVISEMADGNKK